MKRQNFSILTSNVMSYLQELVLQQLQCKTCFNYMQPPIRLCAKGHSACDRCAQKYTTCTLCRYPFMTTRNQALEELFYEMNIQCKNCDYLSNCVEMSRHKDKCHGERLIYKCTKEIIQENYLKKICTWTGCIDEVFEHFKEFHEKSLYEVSLGTRSKFQWKLPYRQNQIDINVIHTEDGQFLHFVYYDETLQNLQFAVINIGTKKENFNFEIHVNYGDDKLMFVRKVEEEYMTINEFIEENRYIQISLSDIKHFKNKDRVVFWNLIINKNE